MNAILLNPALQRLGLTLFHALWEGALIGLVAWVGLVLLRHRNPRTRYRWASAGLAVMVLAPVLTFAILGAGGQDQTLAVSEAAVWVAPISDGSGFGRIHLNQMFPWLALFWALGAALMVLRLGGGLWWLDRVYLAQARPAPPAWEATVQRLARRMGLSRRVRLLASDRADSPLALGWLRPVILVPASAFLALPSEALEAVLAHELAHLRRGDYLANLLQTLAEALLFFHPAAWWLSRQIRETREHCCDDAAAALLGDPLPLAQGLAALAALRRFPHADPDPALAATRGNLMQRITRLFQPQPAPAPSLRGLAILLVSATLLGATALVASQARGKAAPAPTRKAAETTLAVALDITPIASQPTAYTCKAVITNRTTGTVLARPTIIGIKGEPALVTIGGPAWDLAFELRMDLSGTHATYTARLLKSGKLTAQQKGDWHLRAAVAGPDPVHDFDFKQIHVLHQPDPPAHPTEAKAQRIQGTVVVALIVGTDGVPESAEAVEGPEALRPTAVDYAKGWRFEPAKVDGKPVKARFKLTMPFRLR